jgi:hypothetical protein
VGGFGRGELVTAEVAVWAGETQLGACPVFGRVVRTVRPRVYLSNEQPVRNFRTGYRGRSHNPRNGIIYLPPRAVAKLLSLIVRVRIQADCNCDCDGDYAIVSTACRI